MPIKRNHIQDKTNTNMFLNTFQHNFQKHAPTCKSPIFFRELLLELLKFNIQNYALKYRVG